MKSTGMLGSFDVGSNVVENKIGSWRIFEGSFVGRIVFELRFEFEK